MEQPPNGRKTIHPTLRASLEARQQYLAAIQRCDGFLKGNPGDYETQGIRFYLRRALVSEAKAVEAYR
jgi:hypothetical protein